MNDCEQNPDDLAVVLVKWFVGNEISVTPSCSPKRKEDYTATAEEDDIVGSNKKSKTKISEILEEKHQTRSNIMQTNLLTQPKSKALMRVTEKEPSKAGCRIRIWVKNPSIWLVSPGEAMLQSLGWH